MPTELDREIDALVSAERLREAAALCAREGRRLRAIDLYERAALFREAATLALEEGDGVRALRFATQTGDLALLDRAANALSMADAARVAPDLAARRFHHGAAVAFERAANARRAADEWAKAGEALRAASAYERAGAVAEGAKVLAAALESNPRTDVAFALGELLAAQGSHVAAARALQTIGPGAAEYDRAKALLAAVLRAAELPVAAASMGVDAAAMPTPKAALQNVVFGRYVVGETLATSPSARVLRAFDRAARRDVVLKLLQIDLRSAGGRDALLRFSREAHALTVLSHPHVVPLLELVPEGPAAVFPYMAGGSLAQMLKNGPLAPARAVEIAIAVLAALGAAHRAGILHRDVKPSNILFDAAGSPALADFGVAHVSDASVTVTAGLIGSLAYMAPEQRAASPASIASDIYGCGAVLYEAITGLPPLPREELAVKPSDAHPDLVPAHDVILLALLARDPNDRPPSADAARATLEALHFRGVGVAKRLPKEPAPRPQIGAARFEAEDGALVDRTLRRKVRIVEDASAIDRARAFARADHPALATIFRAEPEGPRVFVEVPNAEPIAELGRRLTSEEARVLAESIRALHEAGASHGSIDEQHVAIGAARGPVLLFGDAPFRAKDLDAELADLTRLATH